MIQSGDLWRTHRAKFVYVESSPANYVYFLQRLLISLSHC